ncbi:kinase-like domain-containing protein [Rhizophagus diaphanus]|nr:kinase-like domain-containing protein [Rhizophagus diaphanus] [Rhizophagus sp. MUCL 43196]
MELVNTNDEKFFDPTPRLKSSPIPIKFISFDKNDKNCFNCGEEYITTLFCEEQKYCKKCLSRYINDIPDNNIYLDIYCTMELGCNEHDISETKVLQSIQKCRGNCLRILCFKQILGGFKFSIFGDFKKVIESEKHCKLCGKLLFQKTTNELSLCTDCYLISFEWIESTWVKKQILILYLPWWKSDSDCSLCDSKLTFTSDCQKNCSNCRIFYIGCRYCLTTNIIFGFTDKTQCRKCERISLIIDNNEDRDLFVFLFGNTYIYDILDFDYIANIANPIVKYFEPLTVFEPIFKYKFVNNIGMKSFKWIPYSQFKNIKEMTKGGYGIIYKATWLSYNKTIILKRFENNIKYFLSELNSNQRCKNKLHHNYIIEVYGFTKDPELDDYILVMEYASEGDLHKYLQKNFTNIAWNNKKLFILQQISTGLEYIHNNEFIHRDFHSGNILLDFKWKIGDLGLSQSVNNESSNDEIYGVIPYIAPEIFKGSAFSKEADIYCLGMIMWELTTGCKPFANVKHDIHLIYKILDGERPKITEDTPECYANLMKSCWDHDPKKRPPLKEIYLTLGNWIYESKYKEEFVQAEETRNKLIKLKKLGPEFAEKYHPKAIYTSRPLSSLISKCLSTISSSTISFGNNQDNDYNYISKENELDIDIESLSSQNLTIQNPSTSLKKRNNEELNLETYDNSVEKRIKTSS